MSGDIWFKCMKVEKSNSHDRSGGWVVPTDFNEEFIFFFHSSECGRVWEMVKTGVGVLFFLDIPKWRLAL